MKQKSSAYLGIAGGLIDFASGLITLQGSSAMAGEGSMMFSSARVLAYFLLVFGLAVFLTGAYLFVLRSRISARISGPLMILYGAVMLVLGVGMIGRVFSMMQWSFFSGAIMLVVGVGMVYSGFTMGKM